MANQTQIKNSIHNFKSFYDSGTGWLVKRGVVGQLGYDAARVMHPVKDTFVGWTVGVELENAGIKEVHYYDDWKHSKTATKCYKTAIARAAKHAAAKHNIELDVTGY